MGPAKQLPVCSGCGAGDHAAHDEWATKTPARWVACCCTPCERPAPPLLIDPRLIDQDDRLYDTSGCVALLLCGAVALLAAVAIVCGWRLPGDG